MAKYRRQLPQLEGGTFLTDGGIETTLIYHDGLTLPSFAAFDLLKDDAGTHALRTYYSRYAMLARDHGVGFILESATWRANPDWGAKLGYPTDGLARANRRAIELLLDVRDEFESPQAPMVISGCIGPRGDGYRADAVMSTAEAQAYHAEQVRAFAEAGADLVTAITMTNTPEATGIVRAAQAERMPVAISFTVETDGRLPTGESLKEAIDAVDRDTYGAAAYFMINCAHPAHFAAELAGTERWLRRIRGLRANASTCSHAELDAATELDAGDPADLAARYRELRQRLPQITIMGGCCGTDHRHIEQIYAQCVAGV